MMDCLSDVTLIELYRAIVNNPCHVLTGIGNGDFLYRDNHKVITLDMVKAELARRGIALQNEVQGRLA